MKANGVPNTHGFDLLNGLGCFFLGLFLCNALFSHRIKPLGNIILVTLTKIMISNAGWIVWYVDFAEVAPFVALANPILEIKEKKKLKC
jgi:hypothetical protein